MNEPPLPEDVLALLKSECARPDVDQATAARAERRIELAVAASTGVLGEGVASHGSQAADSAGQTVLAKLAAKPLATGVVLLALGAVGGAALHAQLSPARVVYLGKLETMPRASQAPALLSATAAPAVVVAVPSTTLTTSSSAQAAPSASVMTRAQSLALERLLLEEARTALARGDGGSALSALDRHAQKFPRGALGEEREAMAVQALVATGRMPEAKSRAARFHKFFPQSMLSGMVDAAVGAKKP